MAHDVFISHSHKDKTVADAVCASLESHRIRCWIAPRDIDVGASWERSIVQAIGSAKVMVLVFSSHANESDQIKNEVSLALDEGVTVMPFRIEDVKPEDELKYRLHRLHWLDAFTPPLEQHLEHLASRISALLEKENPQSVAPVVQTPPVVVPETAVSPAYTPPKPAPSRPPVVSPVKSPSSPASVQPGFLAKFSRPPFAIPIIGVACILLIAALWTAFRLSSAPSGNSNVPVSTTALPLTKQNPVDGAWMVYIPPGEFTMGSTEADIDALLKSNPNYKREEFTDEMPQRRITLPGYYIYKNPVTVAQYRKFCNATHRDMPPAPSFDPNWSKEDQENNPIVNVSWNDAQEYCQWASKGGITVTLPTEEQWEKAARGTDGRIYPWGNDWDASKCANSVGSNNLHGTVEVGKYTDSPYGLSDMAGNVWQWCQNYYDGTGKDVRRSLRGGSWIYNYPDFFRCAIRFRNAPVNWNFLLGFRCASRADFN